MMISVIPKAHLTNGKVSPQTEALTNLQQGTQQDQLSGVKSCNQDGPSPRMERLHVTCYPTPIQRQIAFGPWD